MCAHVTGFCAISNKLPLPQNIETDAVFAAEDNGLIASFGEKIYCVCAEPQAVFFRVSVVDGGQEVAYETAVLGRLRGGYRVFQAKLAPLEHIRNMLVAHCRVIRAHVPAVAASWRARHSH